MDAAWREYFQFQGSPSEGSIKGGHSEDAAFSRYYVCEGVPTQWKVEAILVHTKCYDKKKWRNK